MKLFVAFSALMAVASASSLYLAPVRYIGAASNQYHAQDGIGQYAYGYNDHLSTKQEIKSLDGITRGSYSYIDSNNIVQTVDYTSGTRGFQVAATNLPKPVAVPDIPAQDLPQQVSETPEVAAARSVHLAAIEVAKQQSGAIQIIPVAGDLPQQVQDTPEVVAAKAVHFAAIEEAKKEAGYQVVAIPGPTELPRPIQDTPEVAQAKADHLFAVEQTKLRDSQLAINSGLSFLQSAPLLTESQVQFSAAGLVQLPSNGFSYSSSVVNAPVASHYAYSPYANRLIL